MVPDHPDADGAAVSRRARDFLAGEWQGLTMVAIGDLDPVLGPATMLPLARGLRGCGEPMRLPGAGHFVPEHGEAIAQAAVGYFRP
jgi:tRNA(adenine34) deaminase